MRAAVEEGQWAGADHRRAGRRQELAGGAADRLAAARHGRSRRSIWRRLWAPSIFSDWSADPLGVAGGGGLADARLRLRAALADDAADGRRWLLVVDEAQRGSSAVWDEVQSIVHQLGRPGGFAALLVLGQTELLRDLAGRRRSGFASSVVLHVHLVPLDLDEARELLDWDDGASAAVEAALENLHRDARGNPGRMVRLIQSRPELLSATLEGPRIGAQLGPRGDERRLLRLAWQCSATRPKPRSRSRPPPCPPSSSRPMPHEHGIDSVIPGEAADPRRGRLGRGRLGRRPGVRARARSQHVAEPPRPSPTVISACVKSSSKTVMRHSRHGRNGRAIRLGRPGAPPRPHRLKPKRRIRPSSKSAAVGDAATAVETPGTMASAGLRAEGQHEFAPYSQLFTRFSGIESSRVADSGLRRGVPLSAASPHL